MRSNPDVGKNRCRANTYSAVQRLAAASGFTVEKLDRIEEVKGERRKVKGKGQRQSLDRNSCDVGCSAFFES